MSLNWSIENLPATSVLTIKKLQSAGVKTQFDLLNYFPFRHEDYSLVSTIGNLQPGEKVTIIGKVLQAKNEFTKRRLTIQKITLTDGKDKITVAWFNQPYLLRIFKQTPFLAVCGEVKPYMRTVTLEPKEYELLKDKKARTIHTARIIPIYPEKRGLTSRTIREKTYFVLKNFLTDHKHNLEFLSKEIILFNNLMSENEAYQNIHFPKDKLTAKKARERLAFDELFIIQLSALLVRKQWQKEKVGHRFEVEGFRKHILEFTKKLPFELTTAQKKVVAEIRHDLSKPHPMNRFLQGDVGSGKTVVAAIAGFLCFLNGYQTLFMAPTEILANQHYQTLGLLFKKNGGRQPTFSLITSSTKTNKKDLKNADIVVGTHALIDEKLKFERVGLVVIDEQHRFGVRQRAILKTKGINPHLLTMTATPIPRTVALTLYGELDLSVIDEAPKGKAEIKTYLVPKHKREAMYDWVKKKIRQEKAQVFIVCPLIEESEIETMKQVKAAKKEHEYLSKKIFEGFKVGLLHGKMKVKEKEDVMEKFKLGEIDILVSTPVVEVGIDIPAATVMVVEASERYGLAQLHQLRGRVGRRQKESFCLLFTESENPQIIDRLRFFARNERGADIAQFDLKTRGPGEIYGIKQHGIFNLKVASLADYNLIDRTKKAVSYFESKYKSMDAFPQLKQRLENYRINQITRD